jgi:N utilization substance protein B
MGARHKGRAAAVQMLYQWDLTRQHPSQVIAACEGLAPHGEGAQEFARHLFRGTLAGLEAIDALIGGEAENWRLDRMSAVDRNVLRLAVFELLHEPTPPSVVINEALELAREFSGEQAVQFVNGVLDAVRLKLASAKEAR